MKSYTRVIALLLVAGLVIFAGACYAQDWGSKVKTAIKMLEDKTAALGKAKLDGGTLSFGETEMNGNYDVVDEVADNNGCTATIFAAVGDGFKRISTNVIKDGNRAVGTMLDPNGAAIKKIRNGEAFYGEADILGDKYQTGYEPVKDESGKIVGVLYVGYKM
ncbi:MAG: Cache 3/Cache 2 fusion domain-containing protein [Candidatus Omnitrophica bacterium]|jgi:hypothetical protein|nr:Cache 3/Cache 2 fusion domain-containing protein [Candidatus Omnitrophota bacterium]